MASSGKLSAVDAIIAEAADMIALEKIAKLNTAHLSDDSSLPSHLESRLRKLKSLPTATATATAPGPPPTKTLDHCATAPPPSTNPTNPPQPNPTPAPATTIQEEEAETQKKYSSPCPPLTVPTAQDDEEDLDQLFGSGRGRPTLRELNRGREGSLSPPRQACCFGFSPKKALQRTHSKSKHSHGGGGGDLDILGMGDVGEWGDENKRMVTELKQQQLKLKKALKEQVEVSRETAKMARWVKQASARMTHTAAIDDLLSDCEDDDELK